MAVSSNWFRESFAKHARRRCPEAWFVDGVVLPCGGGSDYGKPSRVEGDLVEIDASGRMHLWLFSSVYSHEFVTGSIIGRLFACAHAARLAPPQVLRSRVEAAARRPNSGPGALPPRLRPAFESWNLVVTGGSGCELAGREDNPLHRLYAPLSSAIGTVGDVNVWQYYQTSTGLDLRSLWDLAAFSRPSLAEVLERSMPLPAPGDDFDISCKRDLHLKRRKGFHAEGLAAWLGDDRQGNPQALAG